MSENEVAKVLDRAEREIEESELVAKLFALAESNIEEWELVAKVLALVDRPELAAKFVARFDSNYGERRWNLHGVPRG